MYSTVQEYYRFLEKQKEEKKDFLEKTSVVVNAQMDVVMSSHGWYPKGKGFYTKQFNGKVITIQFRCSYQDGLGDGGFSDGGEPVGGGGGRGGGDRGGVRRKKREGLLIKERGSNQRWGGRYARTP